MTERTKFRRCPLDTGDGNLQQWKRIILSILHSSKQTFLLSSMRNICSVCKNKPEEKNNDPNFSLSPKSGKGRRNHFIGKALVPDGLHPND